jgi:hypothetical protein
MAKLPRGALKSLTFHISNRDGVGLRVSEKHNGLWKRTVCSPGGQLPAMHVENYTIGDKKFQVEVRISDSPSTDKSE